MGGVAGCKGVAAENNIVDFLQQVNRFQFLQKFGQKTSQSLHRYEHDSKLTSKWGTDPPELILLEHIVPVVR